MNMPVDRAPFPKWAKITLIAMPVAFVVVVVLLLIVAVASPPASAPESNPVTTMPTVASAYPAIRGVADSPEYLVVDLKPTVWSDGDRLFSAGLAIKAIGSAIQRGAADQGVAPIVALTITSDMVDRLGTESEQIILTLYFDRADLLKAQFDNLSAGRTLNLATDIRFDHIGVQELAAYCTSDRAREQSRPFCALAESKMRS